MAKTAALCVLFMVMLAFAVQESEAIILKAILVGSLLKKLKAKKAAVVPKTAVVVKKAVPKALPVPVHAKPTLPVTKPVFARATAVAKPFHGEGRRLQLL